MNSNKVLIGFGNEQIDKIFIKEINNAKVEFLHPISVGTLYEKLHDAYDVIVFRDTAVDVKLNMMSILRRLTSYTEKTSIIFILENTYDAITEDYILKETNFLFVRNNNIVELVDKINLILKGKQDALELINDAVEDSGDYLFDLTSMEESVIKENIMSNENDSKAGKSERVISEKNVVFNIDAFNLNKKDSLIVYLNNQRLESQVALQLAWNQADVRNVLYIDYVKDNKELLTGVAKTRLTILTPFEECTLQSILGFLSKYKVDENCLCIVNLPYDKSFLPLNIFGRVFVENIQNRFLLEQLVADLEITDNEINIDIVISYLDEGLYTSKEASTLFGKEVITVKNSRRLEYQARKENHLYIEEV